MKYAIAITITALACITQVGCNFGDFNADLDAVFFPNTIRVPTFPCPVCDSPMPVIEMKHGAAVLYCDKCALLWIRPADKPETKLPEAPEPKPVPKNQDDWEYEALVPSPKVYMLNQ